MKKRIEISLIIIASISFVFCLIHTFAIFRTTGQGEGTLAPATWSVTRSQSQSGDSIEITPGVATDTYNLTVQSNSEVDVTYNIIINNLPSGVEVDLDNSGNYRTPSSGTITISPAGTIYYNDTVKTKNHTLTFRATSGTELVSNQEIDINVKFEQVV